MPFRRLVSLCLLSLWWVFTAAFPAQAFMEDISRFDRITVGDVVPEGTCTPFRMLHIMMPESKFLICRADGTGYARDGIMTGPVFPLTCTPGEDSFISTVTKCLYVCKPNGIEWDPQPGCTPGGPGNVGTGLRLDANSILSMRRAVTTTFNDMTLDQHMIVRVITGGVARTITLPDPADPLKGGLFKVAVWDNSIGTVRLAPSAGATIDGRSSPTEAITGKGSYFVAERMSDTEWTVDTMAPTVVGDVFKGTANTWTTGAQSMAAATSFSVPVSAGYAPTADGSIGFNTTQKAWSAGGQGVNGRLSRTLSVTSPAETKTNSTTSVQAYSSVFTIPVGFFIVAGKKLCVELTYKYVTDSAASPTILSLSFGATEVYLAAATFTPPNSATRMFTQKWCATGTGAPGASVGVNIAPEGSFEEWVTANNTTQPVLLATNGTLTVVPAVQYSTSTSGESMSLIHAAIEERN